MSFLFRNFYTYILLRLVTHQILQQPDRMRILGLLLISAYVYSQCVFEPFLYADEFTLGLGGPKTLWTHLENYLSWGAWSSRPTHEVLLGVVNLYFIDGIGYEWVRAVQVISTTALTIIIYRFLRSQEITPNLAFCGAALLCIHPVMQVMNTYSAASDVILGCFCCYGAYLLSHRYKTSWIAFVLLAFPLFWIALTTKQHAALCGFGFLLVRLWNADDAKLKEEISNSFKYLAGMAGALAVYFTYYFHFTYRSASKHRHAGKAEAILFEQNTDFSAKLFDILTYSPVLEFWSYPAGIPMQKVMLIGCTGALFGMMSVVFVTALTKKFQQSPKWKTSLLLRFGFSLPLVASQVIVVFFDGLTLRQHMYLPLLLSSLLITIWAANSFEPRRSDIYTKRIIGAVCIMFGVFQISTSRAQVYRKLIRPNVLFQRYVEQTLKQVDSETTTHLHVLGPGKTICKFSPCTGFFERDYSVSLRRSPRIYQRFAKTLDLEFNLISFSKSQKTTPLQNTFILATRPYVELVDSRVDSGMR